MHNCFLNEDYFSCMICSLEDRWIYLDWWIFQYTDISFESFYQLVIWNIISSFQQKVTVKVCNSGSYYLSIFYLILQSLLDLTDVYLNACI